MLHKETIETGTLELLKKLQSEPLLASFKLSTICDNGSRIKDFIDIAYLSTVYSFGEMLEFYKQKFPSSNPLVPTKSLVYFEDINFDKDVVMMQGKFDWNSIAARLNEMTICQNKRFEKEP